MKIQKVFKDGVFLKDIYPHATRWQVLKFRVGQWIGKVVRQFILWLKLSAVASIAMVIGAFLYGNYIGVSTSITFAGETQNISAKVDQMKNEVIGNIANLENETNIPLVIDDNKKGTLPRKDKISIGCMQFKISTVQHYYNVLKKGEISDMDAVILALDCEKAKSLAREIVFETTGGLWNWSVATKEMGTRVEIIKSLEK